MKTNHSIHSLLILSLIALGACAQAMAADPAPGAPSVTNHPCKQIVTACQNAGYVKKGHKQGKGLYKDCVQPILSSQPVPNVTVDSGTVAACQAKKAARHQQAQTPKAG